MVLYCYSLFDYIGTLYHGIIAILVLINAKLDDDLNANRSKPVSAIWASWTLSYLVKYDMYLCLALSFMLEKSWMGNRSRLDWRLPWWVLGLVSTSWRPCWSFRKRVILVAIISMFETMCWIFIRYVINIVLVQFTICPLMCATVPGVHIRLLYILFCS